MFWGDMKTSSKRRGSRGPVSLFAFVETWRGTANLKVWKWHHPRLWWYSYPRNLVILENVEICRIWVSNCPFKMAMNLSYVTMMSFPKASDAEHSTMVGTVLDDKTYPPGAWKWFSRLPSFTWLHDEWGLYIFVLIRTLGSSKIQPKLKRTCLNVGGTDPIQSSHASAIGPTGLHEFIQVTFW